MSRLFLSFNVQLSNFFLVAPKDELKDFLERGGRVNVLVFQQGASNLVQHLCQIYLFQNK